MAERAPTGEGRLSLQSVVWNCLRTPKVDRSVVGSSSERVMNSVIYLVGLVVVVMFVLGMLGLR